MKWLFPSGWTSWRVPAEVDFHNFLWVVIERIGLKELFECYGVRFT